MCSRGGVSHHERLECHRTFQTADGCTWHRLRDSSHEWMGLRFSSLLNLKMREESHVEYSTSFAPNFSLHGRSAVFPPAGSWPGEALKSVICEVVLHMLAMFWMWFTKVHGQRRSLQSGKDKGYWGLWVGRWLGQQGHCIHGDPLEWIHSCETGLFSKSRTNPSLPSRLCLALWAASFVCAVPRMSSFMLWCSQEAFLRAGLLTVALL